MAAGSSSRMGSPKQLLSWNGDFLILHEIQKSLSINQLTTFVILGANFEVIRREIAHMPVEILNNENWELGMGASISFGIQQILKGDKDFDAVLISLVDQPFIDRIHLLNLILEFNKNQAKIIVTSDKGKSSVPAIFPQQYFNELSLLDKDYGARYIIKKYKGQISSIDGTGKTDDIDTIKDYKALLQRIKE
ncbi:NTP transferase domain-containing protein [Aquimarina sp. SS2-1]|uniref:nucleotidyltransferase family protein n=1 Tax=Aquimarina besae TaxID=3342247 RepID=UPI00366A7A7F